MARLRRSPPLRFTPSGHLGRSLVIALGANAAMAWIVLIGLYTFFERVWRGLGGRFAGQSLEHHWEQLETARRLQGLAWAVTAVLFLLWMRRVYGNAVATGFVRIRLSPRWVVGTFFVPGVNFVWPFLVVREIWSASGPDADAAFQPRPTPAWLGWWWGLFVLAMALDPGFWRLVEDTSTRFSLGLPSLFLVTAQLAEIAAAVLGIVVVRRISQRQEEHGPTGACRRVHYRHPSMRYLQEGSMGKVGAFVTDPKAGACCQVTLDSGEKILINHDKGGFKGGTLTIEKVKWMGLSSDPLVRYALDSPEAKAALARLTQGVAPGSAWATPLGAFVDYVKDCKSADDVKAKCAGLMSGH